MRGAWWIERLRATLELVDIVRIDHFRGFEAYWSVPAEVQVGEFRRWQRSHLPRHKPQTRVVGSWNYRPL